MISVIVPVHNDEKYLRKCLESIFNSDYTDYEVVVVDDCSSDRSLDIAKNFPCRIIDLRENNGVANARNKGAEAARGEILVFFDSDIVLEPDTLSKFAKAHENPEVKIYQCQIYHKSLIPGFTPEVLAIHHNYLLSLMGSETSYIQSFAFSIEKKVFFEIGKFNTNFKSAGGEEFEIGEVIRRHNYKMFLDQSFHVHHHFLTFMPRFKKLFKRSYLYGRIVLNRKFKLDKGYGTPRDGIIALLAVIGVILLCGYLFFNKLIFVFLATILIQGILDFGLYVNIIKKRNVFFLIRAIPVLYLWYFAMGLGIIRAVIVHYYYKLFNVKKSGQLILSR